MHAHSVENNFMQYSRRSTFHSSTPVSRWGDVSVQILWSVHGIRVYSINILEMPTIPVDVI